MMGNPQKHFAFVSPQGTLLLEDEQYMKRQGSTAENGGQVIYVIEMARALAKQGHKVDIFARNYDNDQLVIENEDPGVRIFHIPSVAPAYIEKEQFYPYYPEYLASMIDITEDHNCHYDIIVGHYADGMALATGLEQYFSQDKKTPVPLMGITHSLAVEKAHALHQSLSVGDKGSLKQAFATAVDSFNIKTRLGCELAALAHIDGMVCVSGAHMERLFDDYQYPEDQMSIIPGGIDHDVFHEMKDIVRKDTLPELLATCPANVDADLLNNSKIVFGFGRLVKAKGVLNAVKAMEHILKDHPDAVYVYAGGNIPAKSAEERELLAACLDHATRHGYQDRVIFLGRQDQSVISKWLNVSDVYLHCAALEPFGLAPQEAAATGIPAVISMNAGVAEVLRNNVEALHTDPQSPEDIAKQTGRVLANPALGERLSKAAVSYVNASATWEARAKQITDFIDAEIGPRYFPRRENRTLNGNIYHAAALEGIQGRGLDGLTGDAVSRVQRARDIFTRFIPVGLPEGKSKAIKLQFDE